MNRAWAVAVVASLMLFGGFVLPARPAAVQASVHARAIAAKKKCKTITKKVDGKKKKVKVCTTPNPLSVTAHPDSAAASSATIAAQTGGTIKATGSDGTTYTLTIPAEALDSDTRITLTPVSSIDSLPIKEGLVGAVQIQPEGLTLWQPATLIITPKTAPKSTATQFVASFGAENLGSDFALYPSDITGSVTLSIWHFSIWGSAMALWQQITYALTHTPLVDTAEYWQLQEALAANAAYVRAHPNQDLTLVPLFPTDKLVALELTVLMQEYDMVIGPHLQDALQDTFDPTTALQQALEWEQEVQKIDAGDALQSRENALKDLIPMVIEHVLRDDANKCTTAPHQLAYYPALGWVIDLKDALVVQATYNTVVQQHLFNQDDAVRDQILLPCRPRGFTFDLKTSATGDGQPIGWEWQGRICGDDPLAGPWTVNKTIFLEDVSEGSQTFTFTLDSTGTSSGDDAKPIFVLTNLGEYILGDGTASLQIDTGPPPSVVLQRDITVPSYETLSPSSATVTAPLTEDTTCPPLPGS